MRFYDKIGSTVELHRLDDKARQENKMCVGVTKGGDLYTVDPNKSHRRITIPEAATILETSIEEVQKLLDLRGDYQIKDPVPEIPVVAEVPEDPPTSSEPVLESIPVPEPDQPKDPVQEAAGIIAKAVGEVLGDHERKTKEQLDRIEEKVDKLQSTVENFYL